MIVILKPFCSKSNERNKEVSITTKLILKLTM